MDADERGMAGVAAIEPIGQQEACHQAVHAESLISKESAKRQRWVCSELVRHFSQRTMVAHPAARNGLPVHTIKLAAALPAPL
jgi:hypothetical protein